MPTECESPSGSAFDLAYDGVVRKLALRGMAVVTALAWSAVARAQERPAPAAASPTKEQCADAYENGQRLRKAYQLRAAHAQLLVCAADTCPAFMKQDCARWLGEVDASTPTIVVLARDADGRALEAVHVTMDGHPLADRLDGRAIPVDPGQHDMTYQSGDQTLTERVVVAEGSKNQQIVADFGKLKREAAPAPAAPPSESAPASTAGMRPIPKATWVLGGIAAVGAVSFATFAILGRSVQSCAPDCTRSQVDDLRRDYVIADVSWITGLVAAGAALYFYLTAPTGSPPPTAALRW